MRSDNANNDNMDADFTIDDGDDGMVEFLIKMDEKLDRIISLLSKNEAHSVAFSQGIGKNISASGMNIVTDKPVNKGQIVHANIVLSKLPFVCIDAYGEIIRLSSIKEKDTSMYQVGIKFLNLDETEREKIVAYVFQQQRKSIRKRKIAENQQ